MLRTSERWCGIFIALKFSPDCKVWRERASVARAALRGICEVFRASLPTPSHAAQVKEQVQFGGSANDLICLVCISFWKLSCCFVSWTVFTIWNSTKIPSAQNLPAIWWCPQNLSKLPVSPALQSGSASPASVKIWCDTVGAGISRWTFCIWLYQHADISRTRNKLSSSQIASEESSIACRNSRSDPIASWGQGSRAEGGGTASYFVTRHTWWWSCMRPYFPGVKIISFTFFPCTYFHILI